MLARGHAPQPAPNIDHQKIRTTIIVLAAHAGHGTIRHGSLQDGFCAEFLTTLSTSCGQRVRTARSRRWTRQPEKRAIVTAPRTSATLPREPINQGRNTQPIHPRSNMRMPSRQEVAANDAAPRAPRRLQRVQHPPGCRHRALRVSGQPQAAHYGPNLPRLMVSGGKSFSRGSRESDCFPACPARRRGINRAYRPYADPAREAGPRRRPAGPRRWPAGPPREWVNAAFSLIECGRCRIHPLRGSLPDLRKRFSAGPGSRADAPHSVTEVTTRRNVN
jgi:hypothetical protein